MNNKMKEIDAEFRQMDFYAEANLNAHDRLHYLTYKQELLNSDESLDDILLILHGYIWNTIECYWEEEDEQ